MSGLTQIAAQIVGALATERRAPGTFLLRAELTIAAMVIGAIGIGFLIAGIYLWVASQVGGMAAAFIMALALIAVSGLLVLVELSLGHRRRRKQEGLDPALLALAMLQGFLDGPSDK